MESISLTINKHAPQFRNRSEFIKAADHTAYMSMIETAEIVADALEAAETLASAVGRPSIQVTALADPGMLDGGGSGGGPQPRFETAMAADMGGGFTLQPQPIVVEAAVDARFSAA